MAEDVHKNTHLINLAAKTTTDNQSAPTKDHHSLLQSTKSDASRQNKNTNSNNQIQHKKTDRYAYKLRPKYKLDKNGMTLWQIQTLDEQYETIGKQ